MKDFLMNLFRPLKKESFGDIKSGEGVLGQYELWDWWHDSFDDEEKELILKTYKPIPDYPEGKTVFTHGNISIGHPRIFLSSAALWFNNPDNYLIALKFMDKAQEFPASELSILDYHFDCYERIKFYYRWRDEHEGALNSAILACKEQIAIAQDAAPVLLKRFGLIPSHTGYKQLAIIYEKQGRFEEAIKVCEQGQGQGWSNDFEKRIVRLNKKLSKAGSKDEQ
ncbi:tetratricopeptide repeat protein [Ectopseudomonas oleovorans]|uniref:Tetratricopeptide repeat protein n=1 Tax=Ectopseudomonas oleovorans TaxID=301 RepID=A0A379KBR5_ECTOL|nr:tetratricopeptide repeat protein [Pseudomonas oleovorans]SUD62135.1 Uncharacterised protein [Pseudomonas oleovorans]